MFLDDGFDTSSNYDLTLADSLFVQESLTSAGQVIYCEKSVWDPVQSLEWKGLHWQSSVFSLAVSKRRIKELKNSLTQIKEALPQVSARVLDRWTGRIVSMMSVVGNVARLRTRFLYMEIEKRQAWDHVYMVKADNLYYRRN